MELVYFGNCWDHMSCREPDDMVRQQRHDIVDRVVVCQEKCYRLVELKIRSGKF